MQSGKISIVVLNWNGEPMLEECLRSVCALTAMKKEVLVVDNGSTDLSKQLVMERFSNVKLIELSENLGFAGGNREGLRASEGEFVALVNNDVRADKMWAENLLHAIVEDEKVGICCSTIVTGGSAETFRSGGTVISTGGVGFDRLLKHGRGRSGGKEVIFGACGAAVFYRRAMLDEIGFFDEDFFLYDEDTDLSFRAQLAGWKCVYVPDAVVYHKGNATAGRLSDTHVYYHTRNLEFVWIKNMPLGLMLRFAHHKLLQEIGSFCYLCLRHGKWKPYFRAKKDALKMLPVMWQKRRQIQARRRVSNRYIRSLMTSMFSWSFVWQKAKQMVAG